MATRQYIGARYVPIFGRKGEGSIVWDNTKPYEPLTVVLYLGNSYISRQYVPTGVDILDTEFWASTGNYNAQVEQYRAETALVKTQVDATDALIPKSEFSDTNTVKDAIDAVTPIINAPNQTSATNQKTFINNDALIVDTPPTFIDNTLNSRITPSIYNFGSDIGNLDFCYLVSLAGSYLFNANKFIYANDFTGTTYEGTYESPQLCDPKDHKTYSRMHIDCATFTTLLSHGIPFNSSVYSANDNTLYNPIFDPISESVKPYWKFNIARSFPSADTSGVGYGRILTDALAKYMFDAGKLVKVDPYHAETIPLGAVLFSGADSSRFMQITHCNMIIGYVLGTARANLILGEADGDETNGIITRPFTEGPLSTTYKAYYIPPTFGSLRFANNNIDQYNFLYKNVDLSTPFSWEPLPNTYGARVITIVPNVSDRTHLTATVEITSDAIAKGFETYTITTTSALVRGLGRIILPYGWKLSSLTCTDENPATFTIACQIIYSDRDMFTPIRGI